MWCVTLWFKPTLYYILFGLMSLLVGLILTALNGPVGTESRGVAGFVNFDITPLKDLEPTFIISSVHTQDFINGIKI